MVSLENGKLRKQTKQSGPEFENLVKCLQSRLSTFLKILWNFLDCPQLKVMSRATQRSYMSKIWNIFSNFVNT